MTTYAVLWASYISFGLLSVAAVIALASRCKRPLWRRFWPVVAAILVSLPILGGGGFGYIVLTSNFQPKWLFWYCLSIFVTYIIGTIIILIRGLKGSSGEEQRAQTWPRAWPAALAGASFFVFATTLNVADMRVMDHLNDMKHSAGARIQDELPAKLPKSLNARFVYEEAVKAFMHEEELPEWFKKSGEPDFDVSSPEIQNFIKEHQEVLQIMQKAKGIPGYSIAVDTSFYVASPIPNYLSYRTIAEFIALYARSLAENGDISGAFNELAALERMVDHLRSFPQLISIIMAQKLEFIRCRALEYLLAQGPHPTRELKDLPVNAQSSIREDFAASLRMEAQDLIQAAAIHFSLSDYTDMFSMSPDFKYAFISPAFTMKFFRVFCAPSEIKALKDKVVYWMSKEADSYEALKANLKAISDAEKAGEMGFITALITPRHYIYISHAMKCDVYMGLCDLALAVSEYRTRNNAYPAGLEELVPEYIDHIPVDSFDGKSLKMKSVDGGLDLYSVGSLKEEGKHSKVKPIHFYLGKGAYENFRVKPAREKN